MLTAKKLRREKFPRIKKAMKEFKPPLVGVIQDYRKDRKAGRPTHLWSDLGLLGTQVLASLAINRATASCIGVGAWDPNLQQGASRMLTDASPASLTFSTWIASSVPPYYANPVQAIESATCVIRILTERWAWKKTGITGDPAGPALNPLTAGAIEMTLKLVEKQPADEFTRLMIGVNGIVGNAVRMVEAGLLVLAYHGIKRWYGNTRPEQRPAS
jgi:hypothetical protein